MNFIHFNAHLRRSSQLSLIGTLRITDGQIWQSNVLTRECPERRPIHRICAWD